MYTFPSTQLVTRELFCDRLHREAANPKHLNVVQMEYVSEYQLKVGEKKIEGTAVLVDFLEASGWFNPVRLFLWFYPNLSLMKRYSQ